MLSLKNSSSSSCNHNYAPFSENDIISFTSSISEHQDPNFFFPFPNSPHMHLEYDFVNLHHFLDPDFDLITTSAAAEEEEPPPPPPPPPPPAPSRRRNSKKDRHSKIETARGPRDRRMRLSLEIARKFFDLQDLLGYDKASRTVEWLLRSSTAAINELRSSNSSVINLSESCTSEDCGEAASSKERRGRKGKRGGVGVVQIKTRATVGRESRRKARDRARERTSQKRRLMRETAHNLLNSDLSSDMSTHTQQEFCPWTSFLHQDEQIAELEFNGKPWELANFNLSG